ncbi:retrotransposon protein, putative, ty1-copia subclass [Tanacetum coccineum]
MKADGTIASIKKDWMVLAIAALRNLEVHQMDVKMTLINGDLEEETYMNQPEGFMAFGQENKVCSLVKSLHGLKKAPEQCHQKFDRAMLESGLKFNECENNNKMIKSNKDMLKTKFDRKDMNFANVILGIKIIRTQNELVFGQPHDVDKILDTHNAGDSGLARTAMILDLAYVVTRAHVKVGTSGCVSQPDWPAVICGEGHANVLGQGNMDYGNIQA